MLPWSANFSKPCPSSNFRCGENSKKALYLLRRTHFISALVRSGREKKRESRTGWQKKMEVRS